MTQDNPALHWVKQHHRLVINAALIALALLFYLTIGRDHLNAATLLRHKAALEIFALQHPVQVVLLLWLAQITFTLLYLPGGAVLPMCAGVLFGTPMGMAVNIAGSTLAGLFAYLAGRYWLAHTPDLSGRILQLEKVIRDDAMASILFMRVIPVAPFWLVSYLAAYLRMPMHRYLVATLVGVIPQSWLYVQIGVVLDNGESLHHVAWLMLALVVLAFLGLWVHRRHLKPP